MDKKKPLDLKIQELILVKCGSDWSTTFWGSLFRDIDDCGHQIYRANAVIQDGKIWAIAKSEEDLNNFLDELCLWSLDLGLHSLPGERIDYIGMN